MWKTYYTPTSVDGALRLLADIGPSARIIAGGTDLLVEMQRGVRTPDTLIDVTRIGGLDQVRVDDGIVHVGPTVTHNLAISTALILERAFPLALACWRVGTPQLRNRGTIAGNVITASPSNDTISALWALGAQVTLQSVRGTRTLALAEFCEGVHCTSLAADELLIDIAFPALAANQRGTFWKLALRRTHAISVVNAAAVLSFDGNVVTRARIALGAVAPTVIRAKDAEATLVGRPLSAGAIAEAAELAAQATSPIDDIRGGADYRREATRVLVRRALTALADGSERDALPPKTPRLWGRSDGRFRRLAGKTISHHRDGLEPIECNVNGENIVVQRAGGKTLLQMLREDLGLTGTKEGCAEGECGACTVWMDDIAVLACMTPAPRAHGTSIVTVEGIADDDRLHPLQQAFIDQGAVQCGYCTPGFIMAGANLLSELPEPTREQILAGLTGNLCRCTGYAKIVTAMEQASLALKR
ncbi:MAG: 2Fe-2S iron-sulfur cluster binding domain-containing protein [Chloroflexi bacterium]|nr:2Fe-2S iron-sulfur cluster binding domain-containing protein [Chloroflexota bacterium]